MNSTNLTTIVEVGAWSFPSEHLPGKSVLDDAMLGLEAADDAMLGLEAAGAAANVNFTASYLRLASAVVPRVRRSHLRDRAVSTVAFARAQPHDDVPTTTTRVRSLGTPIVHAGVFHYEIINNAAATAVRTAATMLRRKRASSKKSRRRRKETEKTKSEKPNSKYGVRAVHNTPAHK